MISPYNVILFCHKVEWSTDTTTWMNFETVCCVKEVRHMLGHILYDFIYIQNLEHVTHRDSRLVVTRGQEGKMKNDWLVNTGCFGGVMKIFWNWMLVHSLQHIVKVLNVIELYIL